MSLGRRDGYEVDMQAVVDTRRWRSGARSS